MRRLMITCPTTGGPTPTGMSFDEGSFQETVPMFGDCASTCGQCGQRHTWSVNDVFFEEQPASRLNGG